MHSCINNIILEQEGGSHCSLSRKKPLKLDYMPANELGGVTKADKVLVMVNLEKIARMALATVLHVKRVPKQHLA